ncbi:hypothetical protein PFICI_05188 [Pestalotiopsis fici W106-1]|uniref:Uncharacterized protein n=1 Tax=Pestalotiopsis fici (strain W106-1 / CGMCC3.15140) TaxID=1229662 RepID=W3XD27_PESFW|nr:uncharacterized protein PFICI_05188 [Pestalotiopsis fici W106-1]ETS83312.1 hypothetical protein PFICI_05188 [Pestalotiopsis fici W106-1]
MEVETSAANGTQQHSHSPAQQQQAAGGGDLNASQTSTTPNIQNQPSFRRWAANAIPMPVCFGFFADFWPFW